MTGKRDISLSMLISTTHLLLDENLTEILERDLVAMQWLWNEHVL